MLNITSAAIANCKFDFNPVHCSRGRKWRGALAYSIDIDDDNHNLRFGSFGTVSKRLWEPIAKQYVFANIDFIEANERDEAKIAADREAYVKTTIQSTVDWCKSVKPELPDAELLLFIRNSLKKQHPEMLPAIDVVAPDNRDVVAEVQKTLQWAMTLKTQACWMFGRYCNGGKPLADNRKVEIAFKALQKKGVTKLDGFEDVWNMTLDVMGLKH